MGVYFQNFYTGQYITQGTAEGCGWACDGKFERTAYRDGQLIGEKCKANNWLYMVPFGIRKFQKWISDRYKGVTIVVTENGWGDPDTTEVSDMLLDYDRCTYYREYIGNMSL